MSVHILFRCLFDVLREVVIYRICEMVIYFSVNGAICFTDNVSILGLWVEHDSTDGVLFALDSNDEFFTF